MVALLLGGVGCVIAGTGCCRSRVVVLWGGVMSQLLNYPRWTARVGSSSLSLSSSRKRGALLLGGFSFLAAVAVACALAGRAEAQTVTTPGDSPDTCVGNFGQHQFACGFLSSATG